MYVYTHGFCELAEELLIFDNSASELQSVCGAGKTFAENVEF